MELQKYTIGRKQPVRYRIGAWFVFIFLFAFISGEAQEQINALDYMLQKRKKLEKLESPRFADNMFVSAGIGTEFLIGGPATGLAFDKRLGYNGRFYVGKWFTPVSGLRLGINWGYLPVERYSPDITRRVGLTGVSADYLMNISGLGSGFDRNRFFELIGIVGIGFQGSVRYGSWQNVVAGHVGFQGKFNLSPLFDVFIEPKISIYSDGMDRGSSWRSYDPTASLLIGLNYKVVPVSLHKQGDKFANPTFGDNTFFSAGVGAQLLFSGENYKNFGNSLGPTAVISAGKWFTSVSGLRLSLTGGISRWRSTYRGAVYVKTMGVQADYLLNLSTAFGGYDRNRGFEFFGVAGLNFNDVKRIHDHTRAFGVGLGVQGNIRLSENTDLFIEPRLNFFNSGFGSGVTFRDIDLLGTVNVGLTYNMATPAYRRSAEKFRSGSFADNMFIAVSAGPDAIISTTKYGLNWGEVVNPKVALHIGKWFTGASGVRLTIEGGTVGTRTPQFVKHRYKQAFAGADYLLNISNLMSGYRTDRWFELIGLAGISVSVRSGLEKRWLVGGEVGLQGLFNITSRFGLYLEPQFRVYENAFAYGNAGFMKADALGALMIGAHYRLRGYNGSKERDTFRENGHNEYFISFSGGTSTLMKRKTIRGNRGVSGRWGGEGAIAVGHWFTPLSGWRVGLSIGEAPLGKHQDIQYAAANFDYLFNLNTFFAGYQPHPLFQASALAGISVGGSYGKSEFSFVPGLHVGLQGAFNVSSSLALFIEPRLSVFTDKFDHTESVYNSDMTASVVLGLNYKLKHNKKKGAGDSKGAPFNENLFVSAAVGPGLYNRSVAGDLPLGEKIGVSAEIAVGKWFSHVSALRIGLTSHTVSVSRLTPRDYTFMGLEAAYLCNVSSWIQGYQEDRIFDLVGVAGVNVNWGVNAYKAKGIFGGTLGVQARFNVNRRLSLYLEPRAGIYGDKIDKKTFPAKVDATADLLIGAMYKF